MSRFYTSKLKCLSYKSISALNKYFSNIPKEHQTVYVCLREIPYDLCRILWFKNGFKPFPPPPCDVIVDPPDCQPDDRLVVWSSSHDDNLPQTVWLSLLPCDRETEQLLQPPSLSPAQGKGGVMYSPGQLNLIFLS